MINTKIKKICFYVRSITTDILNTNDFYSNDIKIFRELGYKVIISNNYRNVHKDCDLYFIWWWTSGIVPLIYSKILGKPSIMIGNLHYSDPSIAGYKSRPLFYKLFIKICLKYSNMQLATSKFEFDEIMKFRPRNLRMIYHGLDLKKFVYNFYEKREKILFTLTSLRKNNISRKCIREIIDAYIIIKKRYPEYKLYIAGDTDDDGYPDVYKKIVDLNLLGNVIFMGRISDKEKIAMYQKCKIYVQPSFFEGFGLAIAEAMACGAPIVTSKRSAIPEVVGEFASFAEPDNVPEIANAIFKIIENNKYLEKLSLHGRKRIEDLYSLERRKDDIKKILDEIFASK